MSIVLYIIEFLFCSALFMALYKLLIEGRVGYRLARIYLVWSMVLAAVIPTLELPLYPAETIYYQIPIVESFEADAFDFVEETAYIGETERLSEKVASIDWARVISTILWVIYAVVVMMNLAVVAWRLWQIKRLRDGAELTVYETYVLAVSDHITSPFAFWRTIYMNRLYEGREREQVILHELSHVRHNHTVERMTLELLRCIFWFNPFVWYAGSSLEQVQEWQADGDVIREGYDVTEYRLLIFQQIFGCDIYITSGLNNKVTKKRFLMMTKFNRGRFSFIRVCAVIPILVGMVFAFGSVRTESEINVVESEQADNVAQTAANGKETTIEEPNEVHHPNLSAPTVSDVVASQTSKRISASISSCLTDISSFEEIEDGKIVIVKVEDGKIYENDVLTTLEALEKKYPKSMQLTREEGGLEYRKLFKSELIATSSNINQIYMNGNKLTYKRTSSGGKASNYNIVCSLQQIATESLSSEVSVYVESATAQEIEAVIKSLEANKSVKCFCIVPRSTSKAILVEKQADGSIKRFAPSPKESKADNPATSDKESDYRIPYGMYSPSGYDTRWEWTKLSQEKMEEVFEHVPAISIISSDELEVYLRREVDFIKAGKYKYRVVGDELFLSNESGESYKFPLTLTIKEGLVEMILGIKAKVAGVKLKEVIMLAELKK